MKFARTLRERMTDAERALWYRLRAKRLLGWKFRRQQPIGNYIVDFVCFEAKLVVELDGGQHSEQGDADARRTAWLESEGFRVLRFWNDAVLKETEAVLEAILRNLPPLPDPSPTRGEGLKSLNPDLPAKPGESAFGLEPALRVGCAIYLSLQPLSHKGRGAQRPESGFI